MIRAVGDYSCQPCEKKGTWKQLINWKSLIEPTSPRQTVTEKINFKKADANPDSTQQEDETRLDEYFKSKTREFTSKDKKILDKVRYLIT